MSRRTVNRPEEAALLRVLERERGTVSEVLLRLAWQAGLSRDELCGLQWRHIDFRNNAVCLADRSIPMEESLTECLSRRAGQSRSEGAYVAVGSRGTGALEPQSISRLVRTALNAEESLRQISLKDLRHDFIVRQLGQHPWPYVARISGMAATTMYTIFSDYMREEAAQPAEDGADFQPDEFFVWELTRAEGNSSVSVALWLAWHQGLDATELIALTWEQVDLEGERIRLPDRQVVIDQRLKKMLAALLAEREDGKHPHVLLTPKSRRPFDLPRLSKAVRTVFIRQGAERLTLQDFLHAARRNAVDARLLRHLAEQGPVSRGEVTALMDATPAAAYGQLRRLTEAGTIVRVGGKYYLAGTVVPPEEHYASICRYLEVYGVAYLQALTDELRIDRRACAWILKKYVAEGKLDRKGQMYVLPASKGGEQKV